MSWLDTFAVANLIGIGTNLDNTGEGAAWGTARIRFPHRINALVNLIGLGAVLLGTYAGSFAARYLPGSVTDWAACIVLVTLGLSYWYSMYLHPRLSHREPRLVARAVELRWGKDGLGWQQGVAIGVGLAFTNVVGGFGASVSHTLPLWSAVVSIEVWGYLTIWLGNVLGRYAVAPLLGRYSSLVGGAALIGVGIYVGVAH